MGSLLKMWSREEPIYVRNRSSWQETIDRSTGKMADQYLQKMNFFKEG